MAIFWLTLALLVCFIFLARIADRFFIASLDKISKDLKLSSDAAGATLMAAGSSAPELFVALFSLLKPGDHQQIGIGSIVGSALFNILIIVGISALVRKSKLTWQPIIRDLLFYLLAVSLLLWGIWDGKFSLFESLGFIFIYIIYIVSVIYWRKILPYTDNSKIEEEPKKEIGFVRMFDKFLYFFFPNPKHYYWVFLISIFLIAGISWVLVELAVDISYILHIPEAIIALTVLAIGTSIPDLFSSIIVARQGRGDMAVSNAIGSNIFDILVGLGLPFLIFMIINGGFISAGTDNLFTSTVILFVSVLFLFLLLIINRWKIGKISGILLIAFYIFYILREIVLLYI